MDIDDNLEKIFSGFPSFLTRACLVDMGIWPNRHAAWQCHKSGRGPRCVQIGRKVLYAKQDVVEWLRLSYQEPNEKEQDEMSSGNVFADLGIDNPEEELAKAIERLQSVD